MIDGTISRERTCNYLRQLGGAFLYKVGAMAVSFATIPLMIRYLGQEQFGVWSTLLAIMSWVVFFDLGVGNGLRNKVAELLARSERAEAAQYISSGYTLIGFVSFGLWLFIGVVSVFLPWQTIFNTQAIPESTLQHTVQIAIFFVVLNFWISLISALLGAMQKTSLIALMQLVSNILALLLVLVLIKTTQASVNYLSLSYGVSLVAANIALSVLFYRKNRDLRPRLSLDIDHVRPLLVMGAQFFVIQLAVLIIFATDKILIAQLFGPSYVAEYEVVFKLFSAISFGHALISGPLWSAYTDAYHRNDLGWIRKMIRQQIAVYIAVVVVVLVMILLAKPIIAMWIGRDFQVSDQLVVFMGIFVLISSWNNIFAMCVNGIGEIRPQLYTSVVAMVINIPLAFVFSRYFQLGVPGIVMATGVSLSLSAIVLPVQVYRIIARCIGDK